MKHGYRIICMLLVPGWAHWATPTALLGQSQPAPTSCTDCHGKAADVLPNQPDVVGQLADSIHAGQECTACHESISMDDVDPTAKIPHSKPEPVNCGECHEDAAEQYLMHGRLKVGSDPDLPKCWSCHGTHDILSPSDRQSHVHPANLPDTCRSCHTNLDLVKRHDVLKNAPIELYQNSIHGTASRIGLYAAATCNDCHSVPGEDGHRTAHQILSPADSNSPIFHFNIPKTCGQCHEPILKDYTEGIHGQMLARGAIDAPVCTTCHGEHGILAPDDPRSPVSAAKLAEQTCAPCHESAVLNEKYGLTGGRLASYIDSYHGLKSKAGDRTVANCASCHGGHRILPSTDPTSSIYPINLRATCGECHPGISEQLAQTPIHATATGLYTGWPEFFRQLYIVLIIAVIGGMVLHNAADYLRYVKIMGRQAYVQRLTFNEVMQHWVLMISFTVLVITGFSLRFSEAGWVKLLFGWQGGFELRGLIHRASAVVMIFGAVWHLFYLMGNRGRHWLRDMIAGLTDIRHVWQNLMFFFGRREHPPRFGRFTYMEKAEYWALAWGTLIMSVTGLALWFDNLVVQWVPKGVLDVFLVIHYYEAWLAFLAILVWHIYGTVFRPPVYPMNPAWISGRMPAHMYHEEHPEGPRLKAHQMQSDEDEELESNHQS
ncbi:MAG: hypothetical protein HJJLKODD_00604 [Phycisphaerae bacterium]|nr:hypothetical protein [Phycisphaerae bacterium]